MSQEIDLEEELAQTRLSRRVMHRLWEYIRPYRLMVGGALLTELVWVISVTYNSIFTGQAIDSLDKGDYSGAVVAAGWFFGNSIFRLALNMVELRLCYVSGVHFLNDLRQALFAHVQKLSMRYFDRTRQGRIISRMDRDVDSLEQALVWGPLIATSAVFCLITASICMIRIDCRLWLAVTSVMPLLAVATWFFQKKGMAAYRRVRETHSLVIAFLAETISGVKVLQGFSRQFGRQKQFAAVAEQHGDNVAHAAIVWNAYLPSISTCYAAGILIAFGYGGHLVGQGELSKGDLTTFLLLIGQFFWPIEGLGELYNQSLSAAAAAERIFLLLDTQPEIVNAPGAEALGRVEGRLEFRRVGFAYERNKRDDWALQDISFQVEPGRTLALVGPTGAGKSSIINLASRFYDPVEGEIFIDGREIRAVTLESLRANVSIVLQDNFLFTGTVMENLLYGNPKATPEQAMECARQLGSYPLLAALSQGFQTPVKERGAGLSQGERQLICFTRAMLADPRILILDEATSSVDSRTERVVQEALVKLCEHRTTVIVAHRLSTIRKADEILVIRQGRIVERGRHATLMQARGAYHDLYREYADKGAIL